MTRRKQRKKTIDNRWHVLFVRGDGRMVPLRHFKGMVMGVLFLGAVMLGLMGVVVFFYLHEVNQKKSLEQSVRLQEQETAAVRKQKNSLMAQLAIAESKLKMILAEIETEKPTVGAEAGETPLKAETANEAGNHAAGNDGRGRKTEPAPKTASISKAPAPAVSTEPASVSVDNFLVCYDADAGRINVAFKIINVGEKKQPLSGYVYTLLKAEAMENGNWLTYPTTRLKDGKPAQTKGMRFRIYNFRTMKFSVAHDDPNQYTGATIFVYQQDSGALMLERDFEINMTTTCP